MALTGLCFITYDGKKHVGRPQNTFKKALESSQKAFLGKVRVIKSSENQRFGMEVLRNGEVLLKTSNIRHITPTFKGDAVEFKFFGNQIPGDIEFGDKKALTGFQMDSQHFVTITIHMHFIKFVKFGEATLEEQSQYHQMIRDLENRDVKKTRKDAVADVVCNNLLQNKISSLSNQQEIQNFAKYFEGRRNSEIPQQQHVVKKPLCKNYECQCHDCLLKKQAEKSSLVEEFEEKLDTEKQKVKELECELIAVSDIYEAEIDSLKENLTTFIQSENDLKAVIAKQQSDIQNLKDQLARQNHRNEELQRQNNRQIQEKNAEIQRLNQSIRQLEQVQQYVQPQRYEKVYITKTGDCYHTYTGCPGLSRANNVWPENLIHVQGRLRACMRCS
uniref:Uncharacterized protein n=1 Tax=Panagrolaimus sp. PS1159 TaxID=55785 RepID=A0AC35GK75_9BILA